MALNPAEIWRLLGVARTGDPAVIRRAYAAKLKLVNPEDDPEGFKKLREAHDLAMRQIIGRPPPPIDAAPQVVKDAGRAQSIPEPLRSSSSDEFGERIDIADKLERQKPEQSPATVEVVEHYRAFAEAIGDAAIPEMALRATFERLLSAMGAISVSMFIDVERRVANLLAAHCPRSDSLIDRAIEFFLWFDSGTKVSPGAAVLRRRADLDALLAFASSTSGFARSVALLKCSPTLQGRLAVRFRPGLDKEMREFVAFAPARHPTLVHNFNPVALSYWRQYASAPRYQLAHLAVAIVFMLVTGPLIIAQTRIYGGGGIVAAGGAAAVIVIGAQFLWLGAPSAMVARWRAALQRQSALRRLGWAPAILLLVLLGAVAPAWQAFFVLEQILIALILFWTIVAADLDQILKRILAILMAYCLPVMILYFTFSGLNVQRWDILLSSLLGSAIIFGMGANLLVRFWLLELNAKERLRAIFGLLVAMLVAVSLLAEGVQSAPLTAIGFAVTAAILFVTRILLVASNLKLLRMNTIFCLGIAALCLLVAGLFYSSPEAWLHLAPVVGGVAVLLTTIPILFFHLFGAGRRIGG